MKRILSLLLCLLLCACTLASCGNIEESSETEPVDSSSSETSSKTVEDSSQEMSSTQTQEPVDDEEKVDNDKPFKHYTFESTASVMPELEVLTSYEELVEYASKIVLYEPISSNDSELDMLPNEENRVEADISFLESVFGDNFVIVVPFNYTEYEELYYNGLEEYEDGTYALVLVLKHHKDLIEKIYYNFDFVIVPKRYYNENMENDGIKLYVEWIPVEPTYNIPENTPYNNKVTNEAKEKLHSMSEGEYIPLTVWLYSPPHTAVQGNGYSDNQIRAIKNEFYRNFASYKQENGDIALIDLPADVFRELSGLTDEQILNDYEIESCLESVGGLDYTIKLYGIYEDQREYRQSIKRAIEVRNEEFCALLDMTKCTNIYKNPLLCVITLECERDYVLVLQEMSLVSNISWNNPSEDILENEDCDA